jgi:hypothetical protein
LLVSVAGWFVIFIALEEFEFIKHFCRANVDDTARQ